MQRRRFFTIASSVLISTFAGCVGGNETASGEQLSFFEENLSDEGISVKSVEIVENDVELKYITNRTTDQGLGDEIGTISASYVLAKENGLDTNRLNSIINDGDEDVATWHIRTEWIEQFEAGEKSPDEFTTEILNTVELTE